MNIKAAIEKLVPGAHYKDAHSWMDNKLIHITEEDYDNLEWLDDRPKPTWEEVGNACFELLRYQKHREVDAFREKKFLENIPYLFPGDIEGHVQLRDDRDFRNIISNITKANMLIENGEDNKIIPFRDYENRNHEMTPHEIREMGMKVISTIQGIHEESWRQKDVINDFEFDEENMEQSYNELFNYDVEAEWQYELTFLMFE